MATFITVLEADMRSLSTEARRKFPNLKDAAERGILKLRATPDAAALAQNDEVIRTFLLACETKNVKLCAIGLSCLQKLTAHDAVPLASLPQILATLEQNSELLDESVQLKTLQLILTLLQSSVHPEKENDVSIVLGICFRLLGNPRSVDSVRGTAAATLRQAVALTFDRAVSAEGLPSSGSHRGGTRRVSGTIIPGSTTNIQGGQGLQKGFSLPASASKRMSHPDDHKAAVKELSQQGRLGLKLLEDIIALANGCPAGWLNVPTLSRVFALDMLEYVLSHYVALFMLLPAYSNVLRQKACSLLMTSLRATGELEGDVGEPPVRRMLLRCVATVTRFYATIITTECEVFLQMLIKSMELEQALWNRIYVLDVLRGFCTEARVLRSIFEIFDMRPNNTNVVHDMVATLARVVSIIQFPDLNEEVMLAVASMFTSRAKGVEWVIEVDTSGNPLVAAVNEAQAITLAIESLLGAVLTISTLADEAVEEGELESPSCQRPVLELPDETDSASVEHRALAVAGIAVGSGPKGEGAEVLVGNGRGLGDMCRRMVDSVWKTLLEALSLVLGKSTNESTVLEILRGYQAFTQACGLLRAVEPRDAFLASLCKFTLAQHTNPEGAFDLGKSITRKGEDGIVLTPKNVQALRTLFNVSHRLADVLGPAWVLVLETLACLDRTLHAPHATTQEVSVSVPKLGSSGGLSDFSILSSLDSQLFESTAHMSDMAVRALIGALRQVSKGAVSGISSGLGMAASGSNQERGPVGAGAPQGLLRMFAVERMVDTVMHNLHRVDRVWDEVTSHLLELMEHESPAVRTAALDALDRLLTAVLGCERVKEEAAAGRAREAKRRMSQDSEKSGGSFSPTASKLRPKELLLDVGAPPTLNEKFEVLVVQPLVRLYGSKDVDMRAGALRGLLHILERHGERLYHSWPVLLKLLGRVATDAEKDLVPLGFQSVRVVMNDCLAMMPAESLGTCVEVAGAYGAQKADLNISLTAVTLLWTTADFFGKGGQEAVVEVGSPLEARKQSHAGATTSDAKENGRLSSRLGPSPSFRASEGEAVNRREVSPTDSPVGKRASVQGFATPPGRETPKGGEGAAVWCEDAGHRLDAKNEQLLGDVFLELQALCTDDRPEVRNSGIRTLFASLVSHGSRLSAELWRHCVWELLLPLLENVRHLAATSSKEESAGRELGKAGGKTVLMLVHHSRNTAQKQWDETLVMYLNGMSRLLRSYFRLLEPMPDFDKAWTSYLQFVKESIAEGSKEVGIAAVASIHTVLQAQASKGTFPRAYWDSAFDLLEDAARCSVLPESRVALKARTELLESLGALYSKCAAAFSPTDFLRALAVIDVLAKWPLLPEDSASLPGTLPQVQRTVLEVLPQMRPVGERHLALWPALLQQMVGYLPGGEGVRLPYLRVPEKYRRKAPDAEKKDPLEASLTSLVSHDLGAVDESVSRGEGAANGAPLGQNGFVDGPAGSQPSGSDAEQDSSFTGWVSSLWGGASRRPSEETPKSTPKSAPADGRPQAPVENGETAVLPRDAPSDAVTAAGSEQPRSREERGGAFDALDFPAIAPGALSPLFAEKICAVLTESFTAQAPKDVQVMVLPDVVSALGRCMITRRDAPDSDLWRVAVRSLKLVLDAAMGAPETLPDWNIASPPIEALDSSSIESWTAALQQRLEAQTPETLGRPRLWKELAQVFEEFLLGACGKPQLGGTPPELARSDEQLETGALDALCDRVLAHCREAPEEVQQRLVTVVDRCAARTSQLPLGKAVPENCSRFSLACLARLFVLCGRGGPQDGYDSSSVVGARVALPILIARCDSILKRFAEDESEVGDKTLPQMRLDELVCMLQELARLVLHPQSASVIDIPLGPRRAEGAALRAFTNGSGRSRGGGRTSWKDDEGRQLGWERAHLLLLYTPLCEMVIAREPRVRELVLVLFRLLGAELGLVRDIKELPM